MVEAVDYNLLDYRRKKGGRYGDAPVPFCMSAGDEPACPADSILRFIAIAGPAATDAQKYLAQGQDNSRSSSRP